MGTTNLEDTFAEFQRCHREYWHAHEEAWRIAGKYFVTGTGTPVPFGEVLSTVGIPSEMEEADAVLDRAYKAYVEAKRKLVEAQKEGS